MASIRDSQRVVVVAGDVTMDWNLARTRRLDGGGAVWNADDCTHAYWQRGGAALLADLIDAIRTKLLAWGEADYVVRQTAAPRERAHPDDDRYHHSYAMWSLFKYGANPPFDTEEPAWRVEEFLGLDRCSANGPSASADWKRVVGDTADADIVVLDDADLGFRNHPELWPKAVTADGRRPWIVLKMARPVAQGALWEHVQRNLADRLIVVMTVNDLRLTEVQISRELSWERAAQDLFWELMHNPRINALSRCAGVVISFETAGALLLSRQATPGERAAPELACRLFFDPKVIEGMWGQNHPGGMIGYNSCLAAGIVRQLMRSPDTPDIARGVQSGLAAMRTLHLEGYGARGSAAPEARLAFPTRLIVDELAKDAAPFAEAEVANPFRASTQPAAGADKGLGTGFWTILQDRYRDTLSQVAERIVLEGVEVALQGVPLGQFGNLLTVDRQEIESFRSIRTLVAEYCRKGRQKRPLSIAVFGAPGSGKSFGITEVARSLLPEQIEVRTYNLSQFRRPEDLLDVFHQVRDVGLSGLIPLVFWDEFDTSVDGQRLGWLRHFLVPMQDGCFQEGQLTRSIGRSIFVFAGGTSESMGTFAKALSDAEFRAAKGPDFLSRLKGYVNVLGPNPQAAASGAHAPADPYYVIRRAILLRSILQRDARQLFEKKGGKELLNVDPGVLRALLNTSTYKHGTRSMESVIATSLLAGKRRFERSCLPAAAQLDLHVDARDFQALVQRLELGGELLEKLAAAAHKVFCTGKERDGWKYGPEKSEAEKTTPLLVPYDELPEMYKESNRVTVRTIPKKLAAAGYVMFPSRGGDVPVQFSEEDVGKLARLEHELWMADKLASGFTLGHPTAQDPKRNEYLVAWEEVPDAIQQIDRDLIRGIPEVLAEAGYTISRIKNVTEESTPSTSDR
jgi:hypothetical protein